MPYAQDSAQETTYRIPMAHFGYEIQQNYLFQDDYSNPFNSDNNILEPSYEEDVNTGYEIPYQALEPQVEVAAPDEYEMAHNQRLEEQHAGYQDGPGEIVSMTEEEHRYWGGE